MSYPRGLLAVAGGFVALVLFAGLVIAFTRNDKPGSSADRTAYSFAYAIGHNNYGRACSYYSDKARGGTPQGCAKGLASNAAMGLVLYGQDVFEGTHIVPGSKVVVSDTRVVYKVASKVIEPVDVVVEKMPSGRWRVTQIGGA